MGTTPAKLATPRQRKAAALRTPTTGAGTDRVRSTTSPRTALQRHLGNQGVRTLQAKLEPKPVAPPAEPFSLTRSVDPSSLPFAAIEGEIRLIRDWLTAHPDGSERAGLEEALERFEREASRRWEPPPEPPPKTEAPVALARLAMDVEGASPAPDASGLFLVPVGGKDVGMTAAELEGVRREFHQAVARSLAGVDAKVAGGLAGHQNQEELRREQPIVSWISDAFGRVDYPSLAIWDEPRRLTGEARAALGRWQLLEAVRFLEQAEVSADIARETFSRYWNGTIAGAGRAVTTLELTRDAAFTVNGVLATVATGGAAAGAAGLISAAAPLAADVAQQATETHLGLRDRIDWADIGVKALIGLVTAKLGSKLGEKLFGRLVGNPEVASIGRQAFARITSNLISGRGSAALQAIATTVYDAARGRPITVDEFLDLLVSQILDAKGAFLDIVLGEVGERAKARRQQAAAKRETPSPPPRESAAPGPRETPSRPPREPAAVEAPAPSSQPPTKPPAVAAETPAPVSSTPAAEPATARAPIRTREDGRIFHAESGRELIEKGGLIRYKTGKGGTGEGGVCFQCNPKYYELKGGRWQRRPGVSLPGEVRASRAVSYESIRDAKPVKVDPNVPATRLGLDEAALGKLGAHLDAAAVERVGDRTTVDQIKGQLAEEISNRIGAQEAATATSVRGGTPTFFRGDEVSGPAPTATTSGAGHAPLTDGIIAEPYTVGGKLKLFIHRIYETKSGSESAKGLPAQAELDYERIRELGLTVRLRRPDGTVGPVTFSPEDIGLPPRSGIGSVVHGLIPADVRPSTSRDVTKAYTPRQLPGITEGDLQRAALMIHRGQSGGE